MITINYTTGYAGTGKSTELIAHVKKLKPDLTCVVAPTHKAIARLAPSMPKGVDIRTIHSLLGWIPTINEKAEKREHIDATHKLEKDLNTYTTFIVDEAGMMNEDMLLTLVSKIEEVHSEDIDILIHCYLDPYQLLPVKGQQIMVDKNSTTNLTTQHRAESLDVVNLFTKFVEYIEGSNTTDLSTPYSKNVCKLDIKEFKIGDRFLAFTNDAVGSWNTKIARVLGIKNYIGQEVQLGSKLSTTYCYSFLEPTLEELKKYYETGKLDLQNGRISNKFLDYSLNALIKHKNIDFISDGSKVYPVIVGISNAKKIINIAKDKAIKDKSLFKHVYTLNRAYIMDYSFATTVHKSQGSEFNRVFIDKLDIQKSIKGSYYETYARLMYVAISRAKHKIYL